MQNAACEFLVFVGQLGTQNAMMCCCILMLFFSLSSWTHSMRCCTLKILWKKRTSMWRCCCLPCWCWCSCGSVVEHCISSAKGRGFNSQGTHILKKCIARMHCKSLWIKASAKCININIYKYLKTETKPFTQNAYLLHFGSSTLKKTLRLRNELASERPY